MVQKNSVKKKKLLIICGPTASGKTALAIECAKLLSSEVISADSLNVYEKLNIGTAKPTESERKEVAHHLIDVVSPDKTFSVGDYREKAMPIINRLCDSGKIPVICGGTGFYINSVIYNFSYGNSRANLSAREKYFNLANENGNEFVYNILKDVDPLSAEKIHCNDLKRVVRALEIYESGEKKSDIVDIKESDFDFKAYAINYPRDELYSRIDSRVDKMIENGLIKEVKSLMDSGIGLDNQCMQGIGYKEIYSYLSGDCDLKKAIDDIKLNTRHYAKRQITYFNKMENLSWLTPDDPKILAKNIVENL